MRPEIDLTLLKDSLTRLAESTYFGASLHQFTSVLIEVIEHVQNNHSLYPDVTIRGFAETIRQSQRYLSCSITKETPYEMGYCLEAAVRQWVNYPTIVTTGLTYGHDFHFLPSDPLNFIKLSITQFSLQNYEPKLIYIGVPRLYVHKPLYCIPLYHELGHFVDLTLGVTNMSFLLNPPFPTVPHQTQFRHRAEHFADLFSACYVGAAGIETLKTIAPGNPSTTTHPATAARVTLVEQFLSGTNSALVDLFQKCLQALKASELKQKYQLPQIKSSFDDIRPHDIDNSDELHGLFLAGWNYLSDTLDKKTQD